MSTLNLAAGSYTGQCKAGDKVKFMVEGTVTSADESGLEMDVSKATKQGGHSEENNEGDRPSEDMGNASPAAKAVMSGKSKY